MILDLLLLCIPVFITLFLGAVAFVFIAPKNKRIFDWHAAGVFAATLPIAFFISTLVSPHVPFTIEGWFLVILVLFIVGVCPTASYILLHYRSFTEDKAAKRRATRLVICSGVVIVLFLFLGIRGVCTPTAMMVRYSPEIAQPFIQAGIGINTRNSDWQTPLGIALEKNNLELAKLLIDNGADVNAKFRDSGGKPVKVFRPKQGGLKTEMLPEDTLLMIAAVQRNLDAAKLLVERGVNINSQTSDGVTALMHAAQWSNADIIHLLLANGADVKLKDAQGKTALVYATRSKSAEIFQILLDHGSSFSQADKNMALIDATRWPPPPDSKQPGSKLDIIRFLLNAGADVNAKDNTGNTPLLYAAQTSRGGEMLRLFIENGADVNARNSKGKTVLMQAMQYQSTDIVELLLNKGAAIETQDHDGKTALMWLLYYSLSSGTDNLKLLLDRGADIHARDYFRMTPVMWAANASLCDRRIEKVNILLERGAKLNEINLAGKTPLILAVSRGDSGLVLRMLEMGADPNVLDKKNRSALSYAQELYKKHNHFISYEKMIEYLLQYGAK